MSASTFRVNKICEHCRKLFEAQKVTTRFCTHKCNSANYKLRKKLEKKGIAEKPIIQRQIRVKANPINLELLKIKPFLTVAEVAIILSMSKRTIYRLINNEQINAVRFSQRTYRVKYSEIESRFIIPAKTNLKTNEVYSIAEIKTKYGISDNGLRNITERMNIPKKNKGGFVYYPKYEIDQIFVG